MSQSRLMHFFMSGRNPRVSIKLCRNENTLYVNISRLREKLKGIGAEGYIRTVRGVGYRF